jgi:hypothetical protein
MILYRDDTEDSELRIAAYIQVMKCPNEYIISQVKDTLASEEVLIKTLKCATVCPQITNLIL